MITSIQNPKIQWVRALQARSRRRREAGAFVVEGVRLAEEAQAAGWPAELVLYTQDLKARGMAVVNSYAAQGVQVESVSENVMAAASDTLTPQGLLVVLHAQGMALPKKLDFVFIPDSVRDPGNLGSMLRSAAAAGVQAVLIPSGSVDVYAPKVVRAAMGAHFRLPIFTSNWDELYAQLERSNLQLYLATPQGGVPYTQANFRLPLALVVGGEAVGAGTAAWQRAHTQVKIPMASGVESLNAAAAAAILLFEITRQRSQPSSIQTAT